MSSIISLCVSCEASFQGDRLPLRQVTPCHQERCISSQKGCSTWCSYIVWTHRDMGVENSDVPARPESRKPAQAEPSEAKLCEAVAGLGVACSSGFTSSKP